MISHVPQWFAAIDPAPTVYRALSEDPSTDKAFADFKADNSDHLKLLFCIDMLNEGVHVAGISGVILFRPTVSPIIYKQQIGRALTAGDSATPLILDVVNNFEGLSSISGLQDEMSACTPTARGTRSSPTVLRLWSRCMTAAFCLSSCKAACPQRGTTTTLRQASTTPKTAIWTSPDDTKRRWG